MKTKMFPLNKMTEFIFAAVNLKSNNFQTTKS